MSYGSAPVSSKLRRLLKYLSPIAFVLTLAGSVNASPSGQVVAWGGPTNLLNLPPGLSNVVAIAASSIHCLALKEDGTVAAWGDDARNGETNIPPGLSNVVAITAGGYYANHYAHSLALKSDGTVVVWPNRSTVTNFPPGLSNVIAVSTGAAHCLALRENGTVLMWGGTVGHASVPPDLTNAVAVAAGLGHSLALRQDGTVAGWGNNNYGQSLGVATTAVATNGSVTLGGQILSNVVAIAAGATHSLALKNDGTVIAWGSNSYGQTNVPPGLSNVMEIASGGSEWADHCLALKTDGTVVAWGRNSIMSIVGGQTNVPAALSKVVSLAAGSSVSLAITAPLRMTCFNRNGNQPSFQFRTFAGEQYAVEYCPTLPGVWTDLFFEPIQGTGQNAQVVDTNALDNVTRFYRVRLLQGK